MLASAPSVATASSVASSKVWQQSPQDYFALEVRWVGPPGGKFFVRGESDIEVVGTALASEDRHGAQVPPFVSNYTAWLPCLRGDMYNTSVYLESDAAANAMEIPETAFVALQPSEGELPPGKRFVDTTNTSGYRPMPMNIVRKFGTASWQRCEARTDVWAAALPDWSSSPSLIGGWRKQGRTLPLPRLPGQNVGIGTWCRGQPPDDFWQVGTLLQVARSLARPADKCSRPGKCAVFKPLLWQPHQHSGARSNSVSGWVDFVGEALRGRWPSSKPPNPWIHIAGCSLSSGMTASIVAALGSTKEVAKHPELWHHFGSLPGYLCKEYRSFQFDLQWLNISWMFWPNKGVAGYFDRDPGLIMKELGLPHRKQTDHLHMTSPHVLALQSGNWDVQERPVTSFEQEMPKFLAILRAWLPQTRIIWLGPLHLKVKGEAWRTSFRLEEHARMLSRLLRPHDIPLITAHSMYSAIDNTCDGRHFELQYYLDWFNLLLNEWLRVDDEVVRRLLPVSDLSTRTPG